MTETQQEKKESRHHKWLSWLLWELLDLLLYAGWSVIRKNLDDSIWQFFSEHRRRVSHYQTDSDTSETAFDT